ncbi:hypothetical protein, partial [Flavonifractor sp. An9]|uniref:hypothetical protein n=1 Tax=Flavonifractor sp. An9 TaxID=1965664 RepID=UPI0019CFE2C7
VAGSVVNSKWKNLIFQKLLRILEEKAAFQKKSDLLVELLPRFELGTSSLPIIVGPVLAYCILSYLKPCTHCGTMDLRFSPVVLCRRLL